MVVDAVAAFAPPLGVVRQLAHVAVVVVRPDERDVVGHLDARVVEVQHLLVRDEDLRLGSQADLLGQDAALVGDDVVHHHDLLRDRRGVLRLQRRVVQTAHPERPTALVRGVLAGPGSPVVRDDTGVHRVVVHRQGAIGVRVLRRPRVPFVDAVPEQRLGVAGADDDAVPLGEFGVLAVLVEEVGVRMHGRPEVVGLEAEEQFEDALVRLRADVLVRLLGAVGPSGQVLLVVDEDAPVADRGLVADEGARRHGHLVAVLHRDVGPPVPGRDADAFRGVVDPVDRATPVAARDHQGAVHPGQRTVDDLSDRRLPTPLHPGDVEAALGDEPVDDRARADRADHDEVRRLPGQGVDQLGADAGDPFDVRLEVSGRAYHGGVVGRVDEDVGGQPAVYQREFGSADEIRGRGVGGCGKQPREQRGRSGGGQAPQERLASPWQGRGLRRLWLL